MSGIAVGTIETSFRRAYIYTEPYMVQDLPMWRVTNEPPNVPADYYGIFALLPLKVVNDITAESANVSFDIDDLPDISASAVNVSSYLTPILATLRQPKGRGVQLPHAPTVIGIPPVHSHQKPNGVGLTFSIEKLIYADLYKSRKMGVTVNPYNRSKYVDITATPPIYEQTTADTVTIDFDLTNLDYA